ncbi:MAG: M20/M25/M40 family metallo-hydrolase [Sphingomonadales bacterium]|nr:M20/M25/M40 family metallo-hydrolase [Sphingomonadales bacterium]MBD3773270.1 M20/M25/M40 family metallo-hydrolase [Paracoccaceae bacterium]
MRNWLWFLVPLIAAIALAVMGTTPPSPSGLDTGERAFSAARAMRDVEQIAREPHMMGTPANAKVRAYLRSRLEQMGFAVSEETGPLDEYSRKRRAGWSGDEGPAPELVNVIGYLPGSDPDLPAVAMMAHHDTVWGSPGAADDTAGVASILEAARAIKASGPMRRSIYVIFTDGEELGLSGAKQFFAANPAAAKIGAVINLEARGGGGVASLFQLSRGNEQAARLYAAAVPHPTASSLAAYLYSVLPNDTDLSETLDRGGYAAYNIAFIGRSALYHSPLATPDRLDQGSLQHMGEQTLALARTMANAQDLPAETRDAVFFDLFGRMVVLYPPWVGWAMLFVGAAGLMLAFLRGRKTGSVGAGAAQMLALLVVTGVALFALNWISGAGGDYYDRLAAIPRLTAMAVLTCLAMMLFVFGPRESAQRKRIGAALPLLGLAIIGQAQAPTAAYFLVIPVILAGVVEAIRAIGGKRAGLIFASIFAALVAGNLLGLGYWTMQGVGPSMPFVIALPAALIALMWLALWPGLASARKLGGVALLAALALALWVRFDAVPPTVAVYAADKPG